MSRTPPDPWASLRTRLDAQVEQLELLARELARERNLRDRAEHLLADKVREQALAAERTECVRMRRELLEARDMQSALLPRHLKTHGFEVSAAMVPSSELGGDYYDIRPLDDGLWIGIGDVSGHGVSAGLVMLMVQSVTAALIRRDLSAAPSEVLARINEVLYENIRSRMANDTFVTATLLRFGADGRVTFAGAHEDLIVLRARTGRCEVFETRGTWLGVVPDISDVGDDQYIRMEPGDEIVLYTDGLTEAAAASGERFGFARLCAALERLGDAAPPVVLEQLSRELLTFAGSLADDWTVLVLRYLGQGSEPPRE